MQPVHWTLLMTLLVGLSTGSTNTVISPFLDWVGYSLTVIGAFASLRGVAGLISRVPGGLLYRPATARAAAVGACLLMAASTFAYIYLYTPFWVITLRAMQGLTWGFATTLNLAMFYDAMPEGTLRGRLIGTQGLFEVTGYSIGSFSAGWLLDHFGFPAVFASGGAVAILAALCPLALPRSLFAPAPVPAGAAGAAGRPGPGGRKGPGSDTAPKVGWRQRLALLADPVVLVSGTGYFNHRFMFQFLNAYFPLWAMQAGLSYTIIGSFRGVQSLAGLVTRPLAGEATRLVRTETLMSIGLLVSALGVVIIPSFPAAVPLLVIAALGSFTRSAAMVAVRLHLYEGTESRPESRGLSSGLFLAFGDVGGILGPLFGGLIAGAWGLPASLRLIPVLGMVPLLLLMVLLRRRRRP